MNIKSINALSFGSFSQSEIKDNKSEKTNIGKCSGFVVGALLSGGLAKSQMDALKTIEGKRNIIDGYHMSKKTLNDIMPKTVTRDTKGKIVPPVGGVSERTKLVVKSFKKTLAIWGIAITAIATGLGSLADNSINTVKEKELKEKQL